MKISENLSDKEIEMLLNEFYSYFKSGYEFEDFLKPFLEKIGLSEVVVTKKTGDGGIDLFATRKGIDEIAGADYVNYKIQAKKYTPKSVIPPEKIDALRGNLQYNEKGLFITTGRVSDNAKENAVSKDPYKPVYVIDGRDLVRVCIEKEIGFSYVPKFSTESLNQFTNRNEQRTQNSIMDEDKVVEKLITKNDIRCTILSVPRYIVEKLSHNDEKRKIKVIMNNRKEYSLTFVPNRNYLYCGSAFINEYKLMDSDGTYFEKKAKWSIDDNEVIYISIDKME